MSYFVTSLSFVLALMFQFGLASATHLLGGFADLFLLSVAGWGLHTNQRYGWVLVIFFSALIGRISAENFLVPVISYGVVYFAAQWVKSKVSQSPLLAMFFIVFTGTVFQHFVYVAGLFISGISFNWRMAVFQVLLPSLILNMLLSIPVHALVQELARTSQPKGVEL